MWHIIYIASTDLGAVSSVQRVIGDGTLPHLQSYLYSRTHTVNLAFMSLGPGGTRNSDIALNLEISRRGTLLHLKLCNLLSV